MATHLPAHAGADEGAGVIYAQALAAGVPIAHHASDLYLPVTDTTRELVAAYRWRSAVSTFISDDPADGGARFYDIPFAYDPFWQRYAPGCDRGDVLHVGGAE